MRISICRVTKRITETSASIKPTNGTPSKNNRRIVTSKLFPSSNQHFPGKSTYSTPIFFELNYANSFHDLASLRVKGIPEQHFCGTVSLGCKTPRVYRKFSPNVMANFMMGETRIWMFEWSLPVRAEIEKIKIVSFTELK